MSNKPTTRSIKVTASSVSRNFQAGWLLWSGPRAVRKFGRKECVRQYPLCFLATQGACDIENAPSATPAGHRAAVHGPDLSIKGDRVCKGAADDIEIQKASDSLP
jgi:hypothetical protein